MCTDSFLFYLFFTVNLLKLRNISVINNKNHVQRVNVFSLVLLKYALSLLKLLEWNLGYEWVGGILLDPHPEQAAEQVGQAETLARLPGQPHQTDQPLCAARDVRQSVSLHLVPFQNMAKEWVSFLKLRDSHTSCLTADYYYLQTQTFTANLPNNCDQYQIWSIQQALKIFRIFFHLKCLLRYV